MALTKSPIISEGGGGGSNSSPWTSVLNVCNTAIGAGVLSFPYAFRQTGLLGGMILTSLAWLIEVGALCILARAAEKYGCKTYQQLVLTIFGRGIAIIMSLVMLLLCLGAMISYLIITGDVFAPVFVTLFGESSPFADRRFAIIIFGSLLSLPLSLKRTLKDLKWSGMITVIMLIYLAVVLIVSGLIHIFTVGISPKVKLLQINVRAFISIDIVVFAFQCHIQNVQIFSELSDNPDPLFRKAQSSVLEDKLLKSNESQRSRRFQKMDKINLVAMLICFSLFSLVGIFGYLMLPYVESDILVSLGTANIFVYLARIGMSLVAILCYPVQNFPARAIVDDAINHVLNFNNETFSRTRHTILTLVLFGATIGTALFVTDLGMVFAILGATSSVMVIFIIPGSILLCTQPTKVLTGVEELGVYENIPRNWMAMFGGALTVLLGIVIFIATVYVTAAGLRK